jgi:hypothetical protein
MKHNAIPILKTLAFFFFLFSTVTARSQGTILGPVSYFHSTFGAGNDCNFYPGQDYYYIFTPPISGRWKFELCPDFNASLSVHPDPTPPCDIPVIEEFIMHTCGNLYADLIAGQSYLILIEGLTTSDIGLFSLDVLEPACNLNITAATPSACDSATNKYSLTLELSYSAIGTNTKIVITDHTGVNDTVTITSSPQTVTLSRLFESDSLVHMVSAHLMNTPDCSAQRSYRAPAKCVGAIDIHSATTTPCDTATNFYTIEVSLSAEIVGMNSTIVLADSTGDLVSFYAYTNPMSEIIYAQPSNGQQNRKIYAYLEDTPIVRDSVTVNAPAGCKTTPPPVCTMDITSATPSGCDNETNKYSLAVELSYANIGSNTMLVIADSTGAIDTVSITTSPQIITVPNLTSNGLRGLKIFAYLLDTPNCKDSITYNAPASCACPANQYTLCPGEKYSLAAQTGSTNVQWQRFVNGIWVNISGETATTYTLDTLGTYRYTGTDANGCPITMCCPFVFTDTACPCGISVVSATPSACDTLDNTHTLEVVLNYAYTPGGLITLETSAGGFLQVPQTGSPQTVTMTGLESNGLSNVFVLAYLDSLPACKDTLAFDTPPSCDCPANTYVLCTGERYTISAQAGVTNVQWQKFVAGSGWQDISGAQNSTYNVTEVGTYRYTATDTNGVLSALCCPIVFSSANCPPACPLPNCATATIQKL